MASKVTDRLKPSVDGQRRARPSVLWRFGERSYQSRSANRVEENGLRLTAIPGSALAPPVVGAVLRNSGSPLPDAIRSDMEPGFGQSFADVRVHNGIKAGESARAVQAQAYTVGRAIVFGPGRFDSGSQEGRNLIAHELAHVAEHPRGTALPSGALRIGTPHDGGEIRAEQASAAALNGRRGTSDLLSSGSPHWMRHRKLMINLRN